MNGIALIIPNADFTNSPLGTVTKVVTAEEAVNAYLATVHGDAGFKDKLVTLYQTLNSLGALNTLDVFPMIGTSVADRCINLKPSGKETFYHSLYVGNNVSARETNNRGLSFANSDPDIDRSGDSYKNITKDIGENMKFYVFIRSINNDTAARKLMEWDFGKTRYFRVGSKNLNPEQYRGTLMLSTDKGPTITDTSLFNPRQMSNISTFLDGTNLYGYYNNNGKIITESAYQSVPTEVIVDNFMAKPISAVTAYWEGSIEMFAVGMVPTDKVQNVHNAFLSYWN